MAKMKIWDWTAISLLIAGGLNWGLVGIFGFNLVEYVFGVMLSSWVYGLVGIASLYSIYSLWKAQK